MIPFIQTQGVANKAVDQLNEMIHKYNENSGTANILLLQQIDALAFDIFRRARHSEQFDNVGATFMRWYLQNNVQHELRQISEESKDNLSNKLMFIFLSPQESTGSVTLKQWKKDTTHKSNVFFSKRDDVYVQIDYLLSRLDVLQTNASGHTDWENIYSCLDLLQSKIIHLLNNDLSQADADTIDKFNRLLTSTNSYMRNVVSMNEDIRAKLTQPSSTLGLFDPNETERGRTIKDVARMVAMTPKRGLNSPMRNSASSEPEPDSPMRSSTRGAFGDFTLEYLGGHNNKNWKMLNRETGDVHILRVEKADYYSYPYLLLHKLHNDPTFSPYIARDDFYYPVNNILLASDQPKDTRDFNFAVTEFCARGDLLSNRRRMSELPVEVVGSTVLNQVTKVANFMFLLQKKDTMYMDVKAENFMLRDNDDVITADFKSIIQCTGGKVRLGDLTSTYYPPEYTSPTGRELETEPFMVYQIGVMLYMLMVSPANSDEQLAISDNIEKGILDFSHPVFQTPQGNLAQEIIINTTHSKPEERWPLGLLVERCSMVNRIGNDFLPFAPEAASVQDEPPGIAPL